MHYFARLAMFILIWLFIRLEKEFPGRLTRFLHIFYPLFFLSYFFPETDYINNIFFNNFDPQIIRLETAVIGFLPSVVFFKCCPRPWFNELMHLGYFSFYLIIIFFTVYYYVKYPILFTKRFFFFLHSFYIFYLIFMLFPTEGPRYTLASPGNDVPPAYFITHLVQKLQAYGDRPTGAFPSSHIGMTWLIMYFFFRDNRKFFYGWLPLSVILTFSTVYIKAHYALDVMGGLMMVPVLLWAGQKSYGLFFSGKSVPVEETVVTDSTNIPRPF